METFDERWREVYDGIVHRLRARGWSRIDAEDRAAEIMFRPAPTGVDTAMPERRGGE